MPLESLFELSAYCILLDFNNACKTMIFALCYISKLPAKWQECPAEDYISEDCNAMMCKLLLTFLYFSFIRVIRLIIHGKYAFFCIY